MAHASSRTLLLVSTLAVVFVLFLSTAAAQPRAKGNVTLASSLTAGENGSWVSPSGHFAFGFRQLPSDADRFILAIWFDRISERTVVWSANGKAPARVGSKVEVTADGQLVLLDPTGRVAWRGTNATRATHAAMLDMGNFVLVGSNGSRSNTSTTLWESFAHPTDTMLLGQALRGETRLTARLTPADYSNGRFILRVQGDGQLVMYPANAPTGRQYDSYWNSNTWPNGTDLVFTDSGLLTYPLKNGSAMTLTSVTPDSPDDYYHRVIFDYDGVLRQYVYPKNLTGDGGTSWRMLWATPSNICLQVSTTTGSGACGFNSICRINNTRPVCECVPGYSFVDPGDAIKGCKPDVVHGCESTESSNLTFDFVDMPGVDWPAVDYEGALPMTETDCRRYCKEDCYCDFAVFGEDGCWKKRVPLANGRENPFFSGKAFVKVWKAGNLSVSPSPEPILPVPLQRKRHQRVWIVVLSIALSSSALLNFFFLVPFVNHRRRKLPRISGPQVSGKLGITMRSFTYEDLYEATDGFKEELGQGSFGVVYRGAMILDTEIIPVAVKKLDKVIKEGEKEFKTEVSVIGQTHHRNLVKLIGYCDEGSHRLLVYEFMANGSLSDYLFGGEKPAWGRRVEIALSIARGIAYLHEECSDQIIHCDIKPSNVLLDDSLEARISDFGLAKLMKNNQSRTLTDIRGTRGYVAPEWFRNMAITTKVDVYSFGVMLLEIICCRRSFEPEAGEEALLLYWAYERFKEGNLATLVASDEEAMNDAGKAMRMLMVALWCVQEEPSSRPSMRKAVLMLEGHVEVPVPPVTSSSSLSSASSLFGSSPSP